MHASETDVAIIGAGPYGLSVAAHLRHRGVEVRVHGPPMRFWLNMPATIHLKSFAWATNVAVPHAHYSFPEYCRAHGLEDLEPCTMDSFAKYGLWVQRTLLPDVEPAEVTGLRSDGDGFELTRQDGSRTRARRVVVATGLSYFEHVPKVLADLPPELVTHSIVHTDFSRFKGRRVAVLGAGASAVEAAALVQEHGGESLLLARCHELEFHTQFDPGRSLWARIKDPNSVLGPGRKSWALQGFPWIAHYLPERRRVRFTRGYLGPAGPWWLRERFFGKIAVELRSRVTAASDEGGKVSLEISQEGRPGTRTMEFDHVIAGTGFEVDVDRIPYMDAGLRARVRRVERAPALNRHFESSVPGLYFVGPAAAFSFGPLFRFVTGAAFVAPTVARHVVSLRRR